MTYSRDPTSYPRMSPTQARNGFWRCSSCDEIVDPDEAECPWCEKPSVNQPLEDE